LSLEAPSGLVAVIAAKEESGSLRKKIMLSLVGTLAVSCVLGYVLARHPKEFTTALSSAPISLLVLAAVLQIAALVSRSEAWLVCIHAAGGSVDRRTLFRAAGVGYLASVVNGSVGMAARITSLRRTAPQSTPRVPALIACEIPIITVEVALAALFSFTLISPLGVAWWIPVIAVAAMAGAVFGLRRLSHRRQLGLWAGLAVMRQSGRGRMIVFTLIAVCAQVARNWLMLHAIGEDVSIFDAMALLIAMFTLGQLPIGPSIGPAAAVLILGAHGVAASAAAGVLVGATGMAGSVSYAAWAFIDRVTARPAGVIRTTPAVVPPSP
jgi:uncharacterized membrane protein YbhN (UPF0104 family)